MRSRFPLTCWSAIVALLSLGVGCSNGCEALAPLPAPLPVTQVIEGGVQLRITPNGLKTITAVARDLINSLVANGVCIPPAGDADGDLSFLEFNACHEGRCAGGAAGCRVNVTIDGLATSVQGTNIVRADVSLHGNTLVPVHVGGGIFGTFDCHLGIAVTSGRVIADVAVGTSPQTGELTLALDDLRALDIAVEWTDVCGAPDWLRGILSDIINFALDIVGSDLGLLIVNQFRGPLNDFIQGLLPSPLGLEGVLDIGSLLGGLAPGLDAKLEVKGVPGGYAQTPADGVSLGVIVGLNADRDTRTRTGAAASEPSLCVPQWAPPDLSTRLQKVPGRNTYRIPPAGAFLGSSDPAADLAIGVSETVLNQAGHHIVASGALCVGLGSAQIPQLNLGTIGLLIPSLVELGTGAEPILVVLRPTRPLRFEVGAGTTESPYITAHIEDLEADLYGLIYERYVRALTLAISVDAGINLEFMIQDGQPVIVPTLVGLSADRVHVLVQNSEFLRESTAQLEAVFPTIINLLLPLLSGSLPGFPVPEIQGFVLSDLRLELVTTTADKFLAIYASLARAQIALSGEGAALAPPARTIARVARVTVPAPEVIRGALYGGGGALPEVELELGGEGLEWQWRLDGGMWRPFSTERRPVLRDPAFAVQGRHVLSVRARVAGDYRTTDPVGVDLPFVIDSAPPRVFSDRARRDGDEVIVPATDAVTAEKALLWALGPTERDEPTTAWAATEGHLAVADLEALADAEGRVHVYVKDEAGNVARTLFTARLFHHGGVHPDGGCTDCGVGGGGGPLGWLIPLFLVLLVGARRRLAALFLLCACSTTELGVVAPCAVDADCASKCPEGQVGICLDDGKGGKSCVCQTDIPIGAIGPWSNLAVNAGGTAFISAYNSYHGDLMVAEVTGSGAVDPETWEFADGVPAGPVIYVNSTVRGGIVAPGDDVGTYTSIAVGSTGSPVVAHYDRTHRSLRYAAKVAGTWRSHTVDAGDQNEPGGKDVGRYTSITVGPDGKPGIAYLAIIQEGDAIRSEVRYALAQTATPAGPSDWQVVVVEAAGAPPLPPDIMLADVPNVLGVFTTSTRKTDGTPLVVYYDRPNGRVRLAEFDAGLGSFKTPVLAAASPGSDWGWYPSVAVGTDGSIHLTFVDATHDDLIYTQVPGTAEIVDDGYRIDGTTETGDPRPVFHLVGDNSNVVVRGTGVLAVVYQDATTHELLLAQKGASGWTHETIAGNETPFAGAYGFFAAARLAGATLVMSTYVVSLPASDAWVEVFRQSM